MFRENRAWPSYRNSIFCYRLLENCTQIFKFCSLSHYTPWLCEVTAFFPTANRTTHFGYFKLKSPQTSSQTVFLQTCWVTRDIRHLINDLKWIKIYFIVNDPHLKVENKQFPATFKIRVGTFYHNNGGSTFIQNIIILKLELLCHGGV